MRKWKGEGGNGDRYREEKRSYKKLCKHKKKKELDRWEKERKTGESSMEDSE